MRVMVVHNRYRQRGGEDSVVENETALLRGAGHDVAILTTDNDVLQGPVSASKTALSATYNPLARARVRRKLDSFRPDVMHVHNFFPRFSPSVFDAARDRGVPSVLSLHNFRLTCASGMLFRDGAICEECLGRSILPAIGHRCYRGSMVGSFAVATMIAAHRMFGTWRDKVDRFIALTPFAREKFLAAGLPAGKIAVKPNFVDQPCGPDTDGNRSGFLYVGRLSGEKGLAHLIEAWREIDAPLAIVGDGPLRGELEAQALDNVVFHGQLPQEDVRCALTSTAALIVPSVCYENLPMVIIEAFALGTPVLASRLGGLASIVEHGATGLLFEPGDVLSLRAAVRAFSGMDQCRMRRDARTCYERRFSPAANLAQLLAIYAEAGAARQ